MKYFIIILIILFLISLYLYSKTIKENFSGKSQNVKNLNITLKKIVNNLHKYDIKNWYIAYGTLLGIVRNNNCIDGDDDIDIIIDSSEISKLYKLKEMEGYNFDCKPRNTFVRLIGKENVPIDFYVAKIEDNTFFDNHENLQWKNVFPIKYKYWKGEILFLPNDYISKLKTLYIDIYKKFGRGEYKTVHQRGIKIIK
jgi:hypothetical protein